jgi:hypothetical protein|tara:strand:- start:1244 stop:1660 length:417 start_codon:yes stop_codon:yes gene_type:complete
MKKAIFLVIVSLALQGFSQVESGVYKAVEVLNFEWDNGIQVGDPYSSDYQDLIHITDNGFRAYKKHLDTGNSYPMIYIGLDKEGYHTYAVPFGDRFEMKDDFAVFFYNFNNETGWYMNSTEWRGLEYISNVPILDYEE